MKNYEYSQVKSSADIKWILAINEMIETRNYLINIQI